VRAVAVLGHSVISCSDDGTACVRDLGSGEVRHCLDHGAPIRGLAVAPPRELIVTGADDGRVRVWHTGTGRLEQILYGHSDVVRAVATTPNADRIVTGSRDSTAIIWTAASTEPLHVLPHDEWVRGVAISADGQHVVTTCTDGVLRVWGVADGRLRTELTGHRAKLRDVRLSADARLAVTGSSDGMMGVWDLRRCTSLHLLPHDAGVRSAQITPDGRYAISTSNDRTARVWDVRTGAELYRLSAANRIACSAVDPADPACFALGTSSGEVLRVVCDPGRGLDQN
jgi:WD40 repeat protein